MLFNQMPLRHGIQMPRVIAALLCAGTVVATTAEAGPPATIQQAEAPPRKSPFSWNFELGLREIYDNNLFWQDIGGRLAEQESFGTVLSPKLSLAGNWEEALHGTLAYGADLTWFHQYPSENNVVHRWTLDAGGTIHQTTWETTNSITLIDGPHLGPTFNIALLCDVPAVGGIVIRDRRDAVVYKNQVRVTQKLGKWMVRPVFTSYIHDFMTRQWPYTDQPAGSIYENYIDRSEFSGGLDLGYEAFHNTHLLLGYRYGYQRQSSLGNVPSPYSNHYHRYLAGVEGSPASWLKISILAGPDIRDFGDNVPDNFDADETLLYLNATATVTPTRWDVIAAKAVRFEQPSFTSFCMYEDFFYEASWKHQFTDLLSCTVGMRLYIGDFQAPAQREDWIYTPFGSVHHTFNKHLSAEIAYSYDRVESNVPTEVSPTAGREARRHFVSIGAKYSF